MENILISACLMGVQCRYDGKCQEIAAFERILPKLMERYHLIPVCPEIMGGLPTPRIPSEQVRDGQDSDKVRVVSKTGSDVTPQFEKGALQVCRLAERYRCRYAILKERSPSCGSGQIYDGTFSRTLVDGDGVAAKALKCMGLTVLSETTCQERLL